VSTVPGAIRADAPAANGLSALPPTAGPGTPRREADGRAAPDRGGADGGPRDRLGRVWTVAQYHGGLAEEAGGMAAKSIEVY